MGDLQAQFPLYVPHTYRPPSPMSVDASTTDSQQTLVDTFVPALGYQRVSAVPQFVPMPEAEPDPTWCDHCCNALIWVSDLFCTCFAWCCGALCFELC